MEEVKEEEKARLEIFMLHQIFLHIILCRLSCWDHVGDIKKILRLCQHQNGNKGKKWEFTNKRIEEEEEKVCGDEKMATPQRRFAMRNNIMEMEIYAKKNILLFLQLWRFLKS